MIVVSGALVLVALVLLVVGITMRELPFVHSSIAVCLLAFVFLIIGVLQRRNEELPAAGQVPGGAPPADDSVTVLPRQTGATTASATPSAVPAPAPTDGSDRLPVEGVQGRAGSAGEDLQDEPPVEPVDEQVEDELGEVYDEGPFVLVVPGRLRYHVDGCRYLNGKDVEEIDLFDAREEGFSPCGVCRPDRALAEELRAAEHDRAPADAHEVPEPTRVPTAGPLAAPLPVPVPPLAPLAIDPLAADPLSPAPVAPAVPADDRQDHDEADDRRNHDAPDDERRADSADFAEARDDQDGWAEPDPRDTDRDQLGGDHDRVGDDIDHLDQADERDDPPDLQPEAAAGRAGPPSSAAGEQADPTHPGAGPLDEELPFPADPAAAAEVPRRGGSRILDPSGPPSDDTAGGEDGAEEPVAPAATVRGRTRTPRPPATPPAPLGPDSPVLAMPERGRFHRPECRYVRDAAEAVQLTRAAAAGHGYAACGVCKP